MDHINYSRENIISDYELYCRFILGPDFKILRHHRVMMNEVKKSIEATVELKQTVKSFLMPARHGKTLFAAKLFLTYIFGRYPDRRSIYITYGEEQAVQIKDDIEKILNSEEYKWLFPKSMTRDGMDSIKDLNKAIRKTFKNTALRISNVSSTTGGIWFAGRGSQITGKGYDIVVVDDAYKGAKEAESKVVGDSIWEWFKRDVMTRSEPRKGSIKFIFFTRWVKNDIIGRYEDLTSKNTDPNFVPLEIFKFAAEKKDEYLWYDTREPGEPLDDAFSAEYAFAKTDSNTWMSMYQQEPPDEFGAMFRLDWMARYTNTAYLNNILIVVDANYKEKSKTLDRTGIIVFGERNRRYYVIEIINKKMDYPELIASVSNLARKYSQYWAIVIEDKANGTALIPDMRRHFGRVVGVDPKGKGKRERAQLVLPVVQGGGLMLPDISICPNINELIVQLLSFTGIGDQQDDLVDCVIYALSYYEEFNKFSGPNLFMVKEDPLAKQFLIPQRILLSGGQNKRFGGLNGF